MCHKDNKGWILIVYYKIDPQWEGQGHTYQHVKLLPGVVEKCADLSAPSCM